MAAANCAPVHLVTVGGAPMLTRVPGRLTGDIDVVSEGMNNALREACEVVAARHHLAPDWIGLRKCLCVLAGVVGCASCEVGSPLFVRRPSRRRPVDQPEQSQTVLGKCGARNKSKTGRCSHPHPGRGGRGAAGNKLQTTNPSRFVMVGDSLHSDVLPMLEYGASAVFAPPPGSACWEDKHLEIRRVVSPNDRADHSADCRAGQELQAGQVEGQVAMTSPHM